MALAGGWFYIDVQKNERGDIVDIPTRGPKTVSELKDMWQAGSIDADTYVWLEGKMPDFAQVKTLPELYGTLKAAGGKGGAINARKAMWYYKDEAGAKQGPHFIDSLRIMYDFKEIGDATPVFTPGMDDFKPLAEVKELKDALSSANPQAAEAEYADDEDSPGADNKTAGGKTKPTKGSKEELDVAAKRIQAGARGFLERRKFKMKVANAREVERLDEYRRGAKAMDADAAMATPLLGVGGPATPLSVRNGDAIHGASMASPAATTRAREAPGSVAARRRAGMAARAPRVAGDISESESEFEAAGPASALRPTAGFTQRGAAARGTARGGVTETTGRRTVSRNLAGEGDLGGNGRRVVKSTRTVRTTKTSSNGPNRPGNPRDAPSHRLHDRVAGAVARSGHFLTECESTMGKINGMYGSLADEFSKLEAEYSTYREQLEEEHEEVTESLVAQRAELEEEVEEVRGRLDAVRGEMDAERAAVEKSRERVKRFERDVQEQKSAAEAFAQGERLKMEEKEQAIEDAKADSKRREEAVEREKRAVADARARFQGEKDAVADERRRIDEEKAGIENDYAEFERIREESDNADKLLKQIIAEERAALEAEKARAVQELEAARAELEAERAGLEEAKKAVAEDRVRLEFDWSQREAYLDQAQKATSDERRAFEEEKAAAIAVQDLDRAKIRQQMEAIKSFDEAQKDMVQHEMQKVAKEQQKMVSEIEMEKSRLEQVRIDQTQRALAIHQRMQGFEGAMQGTAHGGGLQIRGGASPAMGLIAPGTAGGLAGASSMGGGMQTPATQRTSGGGLAASFHAAAGAPPTVGGSVAAPPPGSAMGGASVAANQTPSFGGFGTTAGSAGLPAVRVYKDAYADSALLGAVTLQSETTMGDLRRIITSRFGLPSNVALKKKKIPIRTTQDHHLAVEFLKSDQDYVVVSAA